MKTCGIFALALPLAVAGMLQAQQGSETVSFDEEIEATQAAVEETVTFQAVATELTPDEEKQVSRNLEQAVAVYEEILSYDRTGKVDVWQENLAFIEKRILKEKDALARRTTALERLKQVTKINFERVDASRLPQEEKDQALRDLNDKYEVEQDFLRSEMSAHRERIGRLEKRGLQLTEWIEMAGLKLGDEGRAKPKTFAEIDQERTDQARETYRKLKADDQRKVQEKKKEKAGKYNDF